MPVADKDRPKPPPPPEPVDAGRGAGYVRGDRRALEQMDPYAPAPRSPRTGDRRPFLEPDAEAARLAQEARNRGDAFVHWLEDVLPGGYGQYWLLPAGQQQQLFSWWTAGIKVDVAKSRASAGTIPTTQLEGGQVAQWNAYNAELREAYAQPLDEKSQEDIRKRAASVAAAAAAQADPSADLPDPFLPDVFTRADDDDVKKFADEVGKAILGRELNDKEKARASAAYRAAERGQYRAKTEASRLDFVRKQTMQKILAAQEQSESTFGPEQIAAIARVSMPGASEEEINAYVQTAMEKQGATAKTGEKPVVTDEDMAKLKAQLGAGIEIPSIQPDVEEAVEMLSPEEAAGVDIRKAFEGFEAAIRAGGAYGQKG